MSGSCRMRPPPLEWSSKKIKWWFEVGAEKERELLDLSRKSTESNGALVLARNFSISRTVVLLKRE